LHEIAADKWAADISDRGLIMAWNNPRNPLLEGVLPSFLYGRGAHSWWMAHEVLSSEMRLVFDASSLVLGLYPEDFSAMRGSSNSGRLLDGSWEYGVNRHLAAVYGSYCYRSLGRYHSPMLYEVVKQSEDYMLSKVEEPTFSNFVTGKEQNQYAEGNSLWNKQNICLSDHLRSYSSETPEAAGVPYSLGMLLQFVADQNRSVVLGVAGASYRDMLMSWVCRLRHLGVTNFVVCALDQETHEFSVLQVRVNLNSLYHFYLVSVICFYFANCQCILKFSIPNSRACQFSEIHHHQRMSALMTATLEPSVLSV
jgi:hypothetical protein